MPVAELVQRPAECLATADRQRAEKRPVGALDAQFPVENEQGLLGPDHPEVANNLVGLALVYTDEERYADAWAMSERAVAILEAALGPT